MQKKTKKQKTDHKNDNQQPKTKNQETTNQRNKKY